MKVVKTILNSKEFRITKDNKVSRWTTKFIIQNQLIPDKHQTQMIIDKFKIHCSKEEKA